MSVYYVLGIPYSDELYHHGIKGQKWGVRRYQNPDGTYTAAGKERYRIESPRSVANKIHQNTLESVSRKNLNLYRDLRGSVQGTLNRATNQLRSKAEVVKKKSDDVDKSIQKASDEWYRNSDLRKQYLSKIDDKTVNDISESLKRSNYSGSKDRFEKNLELNLEIRAFDSFLKSGDHPLAVDYRKRKKQSDIAEKNFRKQCNAWSESFLGKYGNTKALTIVSKDTTTVSKILGELIENNSMRDLD